MPRIRFSPVSTSTAIAIGAESALKNPYATPEPGWKRPTPGRDFGSRLPFAGVESALTNPFITPDAGMKFPTPGRDFGWRLPTPGVEAGIRQS